MRQSSLTHFHIYDQAQSVWHQFLEALPVIAYFLLMFYSVIFLFGMDYVTIVSLATLQFQVNYKKQHTAFSLLVLISQQLFLLVLAYIATWNLALSMLLNLIVPFWLIFAKTSSFNQLGYFSTLMTFTFMQFVPVGWDQFLIQFEAMIFCCAFFFVTVYIYSKIRKGRKSDGNATEQKSMHLLGSTMKKKLNGESIDKELGDLFELQRKMYKEAYQKRGKVHAVTPEGKLKYMFALLLQRSVYLVSGQSKSLTPQDEASRELAFQLADYMLEAGKHDFLVEDNHELMKKGRKLLRNAEARKNDFYRAVFNFLSMFLLILHQVDVKDEGIVDKRWEVPVKQRFRERILYRMRPDTFEMRFALRMSVVLMAGMALNLLFNEGHSYWFVMNAFLLLRPMYEDSNYRMKTRFLGTAAGCILVAVLFPLIPELSVRLLIAGIMVACMYTATPGTTIHALFVTCFALTMTTLAMGETSAAFLRMAYVFAAVLFVLVVNRFFFPTSLGSQLRYNLQMLFHMHHMYLRVLEDALSNPLDYGRICDAQLQYHMVHAQIKEELPQAAAGKEEIYEKILSVTWRMASEIQQMFFHVTHKKRGADARQIMKQYIYYTDYVLNQIQEMLHLRKEKKIKNIEGMDYQRYIDGEQELSSLMTRYARNLSKLYILVLRQFRQNR